jgi:acyl dehydratase
MLCDHILLESASMGANAVDEVKWLKPVRPGDSLTMRVTVLDARISRSRPEMGFVTCLFEMINATGTCVMQLKSPLMIGTRAKA